MRNLPETFNRHFVLLKGQCPHGDPYCPCQDGDPCNYEGAPDGTKGMKPPTKKEATAMMRAFERAEAAKNLQELERVTLLKQLEAWKRKIDLGYSDTGNFNYRYKKAN